MIEKIIFSNVFVKIDADHLSLFAHFSNLCQKTSKLSLSVLWKGFEIKSHQRRAHFLYPFRNGRQLAARGAPRLIRVKQGSLQKSPYLVFMSPLSI